ncbi:RNA-directed DNA polymerase, eukaryota [Tanacetum coccineum]
MAASTQRSSFQSKEDQTRKISHSIFVTNFPDSVNSRELWRVCSVYGMVVDVFIPSKKSMAGKRFAFVRFIKVPNVDRLVENLCTLWIGHHHLYANKVRYERPSKPHPIPAAYHGSENTFNSSGPHCTNARARSYANIVNGASVGDFSSFPNLSTLLLDEGFSDVHLSYLGGMWVMLEFETEDIKKNLMVHTGINSWFDVIQDAETDFVSDERIVWVDIEGVPLKAWSRETFTRIAKKWGEMLELEDNADNSFGRKRICIKTKNPVSILESFKIIVKGKIFMRSLILVEIDDEVADTIFGNNKASGSKLHPNGEGDKQKSDDPFEIYDLLKKQDLGENREPSPSLSHPPGFSMNHDEVPEESNGEFVGQQNPMPNGGSVLGVLDDIIKLGQSMGYTMEGCAKDLENIIVDRLGASGESYDVGSVLLKRKLIDINGTEAKDNLQRSKLKWAAEGDENSRFFHGIINKRRSQLAIRGVFVEDFCEAVEFFFMNGSFPPGCNSSFIALIPKVVDAKFVKDFRPISLIGCVYKVVTKILANRLALVISDLVSDTQSAFVSGRQILDGPFILDEILNWCKRDIQKLYLFKVDFAKAYDSVRWDYLIDVLEAFGFGTTWCNWIRGTLCNAKASILVNGSPSKEFSFHCGLKQGDPLALTYLFW